MNPVVAFGLAAAVVAGPELVDLVKAVRGCRLPGPQWLWLAVAVVVPHLLLVPAASWGVS